MQSGHLDHGNRDYGEDGYHLDDRFRLRNRPFFRRGGRHCFPARFLRPVRRGFDFRFISFPPIEDGEANAGNETAKGK